MPIGSAAVMAKPSSASLPSYPPAGSSLAISFGANRGNESNESRLVKVQGANTTLTWQTAFKRSGVGSWEYTGGNAGGETALNNSGVSAIDATEGWIGAAFYFDSFTNAGRMYILVWNIAGTSGGTGSNLKPITKVGPDGSLSLGDSAGSTNDTLCTVLSTDTWYYILMRARTSNGADGKAQELYVYNGTTGALIASCTKEWDVGAGAASDLLKFGVGTTMNTTGAHFFMEDGVVYKGLLTNPGPQRIYTRRPTAVSAAGNWVAHAPLGTPGGTIPANIDDVGTDEDATVARVGHATESQLVLDLDTIDIPSTDVVHAVVTWARQRHTGSTPTVHYGIKSGSTTSTTFVNSGGGYGNRRVLHATDPATAADWTETAAEGFQGVLHDADALLREIVVTSAAWDVVTAQVAA